MDKITYQRGEWPPVKVRSRRSWSHGICIGHCELRLWNPERGMVGSIASHCPEVAWKNMKGALLIRIRDTAGKKRHAGPREKSTGRISRSSLKQAFSLHMYSMNAPVLFKRIVSWQIYAKMIRYERDRSKRLDIQKRDLRSVIYLSPGTAVTDLWSGLVIHVTCGVGLPCAEQPNWEPVVFEKTRVLGGSRMKTGPCWPSANFTLHPRTESVFAH